MPDIGPEMKSLREITDQFENGAFNLIPAIDRTIRGLNDKLPGFRATGEAISSLMKESFPARSIDHSIHPRELVSQIKDHILASPAKALSSQGNINYIAIDRLMA
jgi:hypothetical protein